MAAEPSAAAGAAPACGPPLFVGGTGRSGTHAVAKLLGRHSQLFYVSRELRFHTDRGGLPDLLDGLIDVDHFLRNMRDYYWRRPGADGRERGLHSKFRKKNFEAALERFEQRARDDVATAGAALLHDLLDPMAADVDKPVWIEQTPQTAAAGAALFRMFPEMKLIHMVRDGRDVASSLTGQWWGPRTMRGGLKWWERRLRAADEGASAVPSGRVLTMALEDLVIRKREPSYARLLDFLGLEDERKMRKHFDKQLVPENANIGRWRRDMSARRQARVDRAYLRSLERMRADGVRSAPDPKDVDEP
jgi:hypothetical protein